MLIFNILGLFHNFMIQKYKKMNRQCHGSAYFSFDKKGPVSLKFGYFF